VADRRRVRAGSDVFAVLVDAVAVLPMWRWKGRAKAQPDVSPSAVAVEVAAD
jgi:hypothetical protein